MSVSRRQFLWSAAAAAAAWPHVIDAQTSDADSAGAFRHGVASGDPLADRVILWTRVTPLAAGAAAPIDVRWRIAGDAALARVIATGVARTSADRDFTVKIDAGGLQPGREYFYAFEADGERSPVGRTRTLPAGAVDRVRLASVCCANYPAGVLQRLPLPSPTGPTSTRSSISATTSTSSRTASTATARGCCAFPSRGARP